MPQKEAGTSFRLPFDRHAIVVAGLFAVSVGVTPGIAMAQEAPSQDSVANGSTAVTTVEATQASTTTAEGTSSEQAGATAGKAADAAQQVAQTQEGASDKQTDAALTQGDQAKQSATSATSAEPAAAQSGMGTAKHMAPSKSGSGTSDGSAAANVAEATAATTATEGTSTSANAGDTTTTEDPHADEIAAIQKQFGGNATVTYKDGVYNIVVTGDVSTTGITVPKGESWSVDLAGHTVQGTDEKGMPTFLVKDADSSLSIGGGTVKGSDVSYDAGDALRVTNGSLEVRDGTYTGGNATGPESVGGSAVSAYSAKSVVVKSGTLTGGNGEMCGGCGLYLQGWKTQVTIGSLPSYGTYKDPRLTGGNSSVSAGNGLAIEEVGHVTILSGDFEAGEGGNRYQQLYWMRGQGQNSNSWAAGNDSGYWYEKFNYCVDEIGPDFVTKMGMAIFGDAISSYQDILSGHFGSIRVTKKSFSSLFANHKDVVAFDDQGNEVDIRNYMGSTTLALAGSIAITPKATDASGNDVSAKLPAGSTFTYEVYRYADDGTKSLFTGKYDVMNDDGTVSEQTATDGVITLKVGQMALVHALSASEVRYEVNGVRFDVVEASHADGGEDLRYQGVVDGETNELTLKFAKGEGNTYRSTFDNVYNIKHAVTYSYSGDVPEGAVAPEGQSLFAGDVVTLPNPEAVSGYHFVGWQLADGTAVTDDMSMPDADVALVGVWEKDAQPVDNPSGTTSTTTTPRHAAERGAASAPRHAAAYVPRHAKSAVAAKSSLPATGDNQSQAGLLATLGAGLAAVSASLAMRRRRD